MVEVKLNQDSILDFFKCPHILSICHLEHHSWISVYFFIHKLIGWWRHNKTILKCTLKSESDTLNGKYLKYVDTLENLKCCPDLF